MIPLVPGSLAFTYLFLVVVLGRSNRQGPIKIAIRERHNCKAGKMGMGGGYGLKKSVSRFQEKEKRGEMITINDNIK